MKKIFYIPLLTSLFVIGPIYSQSVDKIVAQHFEATGQDQLKKVKTITITGNAFVQRMNFTYTLVQQRPNKMHLELNANDIQVIQAFDGENGWAINQMMGASTVEDLSPLQLKSMKDQANIDGLLDEWEKNGHELILVENTENDSTYKMKLKRKYTEGEYDTMYYYINKNTYLLAQITTIINFKGDKSATDVFLSNYKEVDGIMFPYAIESIYKGQKVMDITVDTIELDKEYDDSFFKKPDE